MKTLLVTGAGGLVGSAVVDLFCERGGWQVVGIDNDQRAVFFGPAATTAPTVIRLVGQWPEFSHVAADIRDEKRMRELVAEVRPDAIVHTAAQPSHDRAASIPFDDFAVNACGTQNLLEAARRACPESPFVHLSTNKVYGDAPNELAMVERETRWDYRDEANIGGITETMRVDQSKHSLFGASKLAADILAQEYGRYFGMPTCCLRGGCLTGPAHAGVELHGFLSYLVRCNVAGETYRIYGYGGKQVRDNLDARDVASFAWEFIAAPRVAEVYNLGGGWVNSISILEAFEAVTHCTGKPMQREYVDQPRIGDHICYYSDLRKIRAHYPNWDVRISLPDIIESIARAWTARLGA